MEDCDKICSTPQKRRMHLTDKHMYPKVDSIHPSLIILYTLALTAHQNYDFLIVNSGIDNRSSMLRTSTRRPSSAVSPAMDGESLSIDVRTRYRPLQNPKGSKAKSPWAASVKEETTVLKDSGSDAAIDDITGTISALRFVPPSVRFGRGGRRGGLSRS